MDYTVDRIEGQYAICEDTQRKMTEILLSEFPFHPLEGMRFSVGYDGKIRLIPRKGDDIAALSEKLWRD